MSADAKKEYGSTMVLIILGVLALYGGARWLLVLIPAALLIWYVTAGGVLGKAGPDQGWMIIEAMPEGSRLGQ